MRISFLLTIVVILQYSSCKQDEYCEQEYTFSIPNTISPALDTFHVGDTLWFTSMISVEMVEKNTGESYDVNNLNFPIAIRFTRLDTEEFVHSINAFDYYNIVGGIRVDMGLTTHTALLQYERLEDDTRKCYASIICKEIGDFELGTANLTEDFENINLTSSDCIEDIFLHYSMNGDTSDNHFYLLSDRPRPVADEAGFKQNGGYAFAVIE